MSEFDINRSDLLKIHDVLRAALRHHRARDAMNAELHLAREIRWSPLTSELDAAFYRLAKVLQTHDIGSNEVPPWNELRNLADATGGR